MQRIGVDILGIERMATAIHRSGDGFLHKAFTAAEIAYCAGSPERLAGRWAAKEAVIKCFDGTPICFPRRSIEVLPAESGAPRVRLHGDARGATVQVSITHQAGVAVASAVLDMPDTPPLTDPPAAVRIPVRPPDAHKGTFGTVGVVAGSLGLTGAAYLSSTAAARTGAGMVRLLVAAGIYPVLAAKSAEVMATPVPEVAPGAVGQGSLEAVLGGLEGTASAVVGPGLGRDSSTWQLVHELVARIETPLVLDADALNALAASPRTLNGLGPNRVLTPHPGEMARLTHLSAARINEDRERTAARFAEEWQATVVLKGAHTVVAAPGGRVSVDPHAVPALASGGTGDVLSGVIGALLAQGLEPFDAAVTGVYVHAAAGAAVQARLGTSGLLASDLFLEIPRVMEELRRAGR